MRDETDLLERPTGATGTSGTSTLKTILLHVQNDKALDDRLEAALALARPSSAHITCLHVTPIEAYVAFDSLGGVFVMNDVIDALNETEKGVRERIQNELRNEDVTWDYVEVTGNVLGQILSHACLADLVVTGREPHRSDFAGPAVGLLGDLLQHSRTPLFVAGGEKNPDPTGPALIAWDGSAEAANAVRASIGLLKLARDVRVLSIEEGAAKPFPGTKLLEYLSRQGIHAELTREASRQAGDHDFVCASLLAHARAIGAAYIVMGGYNHSRVGEYIFGGVTRTMLSSANVPLVISR